MNLNVIYDVKEIRLPSPKKEGRSGQRRERRITDEDNGYFHYSDCGDSFTYANLH